MNLNEYPLSGGTGVNVELFDFRICERQMLPKTIFRHVDKSSIYFHKINHKINAN